MNIFYKIYKEAIVDKEGIKRERNKQVAYNNLLKEINRIVSNDANSLRLNISMVLENLMEDFNDLDFEDKVDIAYRLLYIIEYTEFNIFRQSIYSDEALTNITKALVEIRRNPTEESFKNYSKILCDNYSSLTETQKKVENDFYSLKCELIDKITEVLLC